MSSNQPVQNQPGLFKSTAVVLAVTLFFLYEFINLASFNALNDQLRQAFNVNAVSMSNLSAMYFYANVLFLIPSGVLLDHFSTKKLVLIAFAVSIIATVVFAFSHNYWVAAATRFVIGWGSTFCLISLVQLTSRWFLPKHAGVMIGLGITVAMLGGMIAQPISDLSVWMGGWRHAMICVAILGAIFWVGILLIVKDYPQGHEKEHERDLKELSQYSILQLLCMALRNVQTWLAGAFVNLLSIPVIVIGALWGQGYLIAVDHLKMVDAQWVASMVFLGLVIGSPIFGWLSDALHRRKSPMIFGAIMTLVMSLIIVYWPSGSPWLLALFFLLLGFFSAAQVVAYPLVAELNPRHLVASSEGLCATIIMSCGALFQPLYGYILHHSHHSHHGVLAHYTAFDYQRAMWMLPVAFLVCLILSLFLKESHAQRQES